MSFGIVVVAIVSVAAIIFMAAFYLVACLKPDLVWMLNAPDGMRRYWPAERRQIGRWYHAAWILIAMFSTGVCVQTGVSEFLSWMPKSWHTNGVWMADAVGSFCGIMAGFLLPTGVIHLSGKLGQQQQENRELRALVRRHDDERRKGA